MPIGAVPSSGHIRFNPMKHRATSGTPDGPASRKMGSTLPSSGQLSHWSLVRDGANMTQEYYGIAEGRAKDRSSRLIEVINNDTHIEVTTINVIRGSMIYLVNYETGNILELENPTRKKSYIQRFNPDTFPRNPAEDVDITEVGFWTVFGNYWPPVKFNDDNFSKRDLDHEVGGLVNEKESETQDPIQDEHQDQAQDQQQHDHQDQDPVATAKPDQTAETKEPEKQASKPET